MSKVLTCRPKPPDIKAVQWDDSLEAHNALIDLLPRPPGRISGALCVLAHFGVAALPVGYYVVNHDGVVDVMSEEAFLARYEEVPCA